MESSFVHSKYALVSRQVDLITNLNSETLPLNFGYRFNDTNTHVSKYTAVPGTLIKIIETFDTIDSKNCIVQIINFNNDNKRSYICNTKNLLRVSEDIWPYVISIQKFDRRLRLAANKEQCLWLLSLKVNDLIAVQCDLPEKSNVSFDCIIRYIGPIQELSSVGYYFGLELLHLNNGHSPQENDIPFAIKYIQCDPSLSIFTTADRVTPIQSELSHRAIAKKFFNDAIERVNTTIVPAVLNVFDQQGDKKYKTQQGTSQFYVASSLPNQKTNDLETVNCSNIPLSTENKATSHIIETNTDPFQKNTLDGKKNISTMSNKNKEIIVINKGDIEESTKNEHNVVVVNNPQENVDLAELLGSNWPKNAGGAALMLNGTQITAKSKDNKFEKRDPSEAAQTTEIQSVSNHEFSKLESNHFEDVNNFNYRELHEIPGTKLTTGSMVEVSDSEICSDLYGVIRWIGIPPDSSNVIVGIEVEDDQNLRGLSLSDGTYNGTRLFQCREGGAIFVPSNRCANDKRFADIEGNHSASCDKNAIKFGHVKCPLVFGAVPPLRIHNTDELEEICGKFKGIQGHHNSCYLDATLFSMFTFTSVFDSILYRKPDSQDIAQYSEVQNVLRNEIVNPLRKHVFVRADRVMKLRKLLDQLSSVSGLTSEEKDPEEVLNSLLSQIMRVEPFLKLSSGQDSYFYQLFVEKDERLTFPTVQQLFEQSFHSSDIKLKEVPSCLIIQMPRFGKSFKMYPRILPSQVLDVTNIIEDSPRQCSVCGKLAEFECRECFGCLQAGAGLDCTAYCQQCLKTVHSHPKRINHVSKPIIVPKDFKTIADHMTLPRLYMELFAVVCIETSHYVAFVKAGCGPDAPWCFFDSMADRKGEKNGYNIPEMISVPELPQWLSDEGSRVIIEKSIKDKVLPEHAKRLFCDAYMCMYQSTDVMMYH